MEAHFARMFDKQIEVFNKFNERGKFIEPM